MADKADIGLIGLAVMGQNLILNINDKLAKKIYFKHYKLEIRCFFEVEKKKLLDLTL